MKANKTLVLIIAFFLAGCNSIFTPVPVSTQPEIILTPAPTHPPQSTQTPESLASNQEFAPSFTPTLQTTPTEQPYHCIFTESWMEPSGAWIGMSVQCQNPGSPRVDVLGFNREHWTFELPEYDTRYAYFLFKWSYEGDSNNKYLYFYLLLTWPWDSRWNSYQPARGLFRMNLSNGITDVILNEKEHNPYNAISLSPDGQAIAYLAFNGAEKEIGIKNVQTGRENTIVIDGFDDGGSFLWSSDMKNVAFVLSNIDYDKHDHRFPKKETVFVLDVETMSLAQVYSVDTFEKTIEPLSLKGENLVINDMRYKYLISVDLQTGKETKLYPTPTPTP
jgi:hypothetical protein